MAIRDVVYSIVRQVAADQGRELQPLTDHLALTESGLDSLSFAIVVTSLEDTLYLDPFAAADGVNFPLTLGDLVELYERAAG